MKILQIINHNGTQAGTTDIDLDAVGADGLILEFNSLDFSTIAYQTLRPDGAASDWAFRSVLGTGGNGANYVVGIPCYCETIRQTFTGAGSIQGRVILVSGIGQGFGSAPLHRGTVSIAFGATTQLFTSQSLGRPPRVDLLLSTTKAGATIVGATMGGAALGTIRSATQANATGGDCGVTDIRTAGGELTAYHTNNDGAANAAVSWCVVGSWGP